MKYRVINQVLKLRCGRDFDSMAEAVKYRQFCLSIDPEGRYTIRDVKEAT